MPRWRSQSGDVRTTQLRAGPLRRDDGQCQSVHADAMAATASGVPTRRRRVVGIRECCHVGGGLFDGQCRVLTIHREPVREAQRREHALAQDDKRQQPHHRHKTTAQASDERRRNQRHRLSVPRLAGLHNCAAPNPASTDGNFVASKQGRRREKTSIDQRREQRNPGLLESGVHHDFPDRGLTETISSNRPRFFAIVA